MEIRELCDIFNNKARIAAVKKLLTAKRNRVVSVDGLAGSSAAMLFARLPRLEAPYLIIANDLDEAGYIYNDICQINGEDSTLIFPSGYKRDIKYGQIDAPSEILRTEVLNQWYGNPKLQCVVTYPEALAEKVAAKEVIDHTTITLTVGSEVDLIATGAQLREFGFKWWTMCMSRGNSQFVVPFSTCFLTATNCPTVSTFSAMKSTVFAHSTSKPS